MRHEDVLNRLKQYKQAVIHTELLRRRLDVLDERSKAARTTNLTGLPGGKGMHADRTEYYAAKIVDLMAEIEQHEDEAEGVRKEVESFINQIAPTSEKNLRFIQVLEMRYLDLLPWGDIGITIAGLSADDDETKKESAMRRAFSFHGDAITLLEKIAKG